MIEATLHNNDKRVTIAIRDSCAFTFLLPTTDEPAQCIFQTLDSTDVKIVKQQPGFDSSGELKVEEKDVYVQSNMLSHDSEEDIRTGNSYTEASMTLHKVSWTDEEGNEEPIPKYTLNFQLVSSFARANMDSSNCFVNASAPLITADN